MIDRPILSKEQIINNLTLAIKIIEELMPSVLCNPANKQGGYIIDFVICKDTKSMICNLILDVVKCLERQNDNKET